MLQRLLNCLRCLSQTRVSQFPRHCCRKRNKLQVYSHVTDLTDGWTLSKKYNIWTFNYCRIFKIIKICDFLELEFDQNASVQDFHVSDGVWNVDKISVYVKKFKFAERQIYFCADCKLCITKDLIRWTDSQICGTARACYIRGKWVDEKKSRKSRQHLQGKW